MGLPIQFMPMQQPAKAPKDISWVKIRFLEGDKVSECEESLEKWHSIKMEITPGLVVLILNDKKTEITKVIGFLLDKNSINPLNSVTGNNIDTPMLIMEHILPIPVW